MMGRKKADTESIVSSSFVFMTKVDRQVQKAAGLDIPDTFGLDDILKSVEVTEKPIYILWNNGEPVASETGGPDCIAYLRLENGSITGWSI